MRDYNRANVPHAKSLRKEMSEVEEILWSRIRNNQLGVRFRRQVPVGNYFLDFYCATSKLCIEVDGGQHADRVERDNERDAFLLEKGIKTLRFWASEVRDNLRGVLDSIAREIDS